MNRTMVFAQSLVQDLRYGWRQFWSSPVFSAVAIITLALGVGVNTSIFSLLNALMLRPLDVSDSGGFFEVLRGNGRPCSYPDFLDFQRRTGNFARLAADTTTESALDVGDSSRLILLEAVSYDYAVVVGIKPQLGRWFTADDEHTGQFPAVISYETWQSRFGADPNALGKQIRVESQWYTVVGVAPKNFQGMAMPVLTAVWVPLVRYAQHNEFGASTVQDRFAHRVMMFARLKTGVTAAAAQAELNAVSGQLRREYPGPEVRELPLHLEVARGTSDPGYRRMVGPVLMLLSAVVGLVLLISCGNVGNLLLSRGVSRRREIGARLAVGATAVRICRQLLLESLLLSFMGAGAGLVAAIWTNRILEHGLSSAPSDIVLGAQLSLDGRVLGFVLAAAIVTTFLFGLFPALQASKADVVTALKGSEMPSRNRRFTLRNASVVAQVTFSLMLLIAAGLFLRALEKASSINPGFDARKLLSARLYLAKPEFNADSGLALYRRILENTRSLPGVTNATLSYASPMLTMSDCVAPDRPRATPEWMTAGANIVGTGYFSTLGLPLIRGREFTISDNASAPSVVIVNEQLARRYWPAEDPIGKRIRFGAGCEHGQGTAAEIVGVVQDAQYASLDTRTRPYVFYPFAQRYVGYVALIMRTRQSPGALAPGLRKHLSSIDNRLRIYEIDTLPNQMDRALWQTKWEVSLLGAFGTVALLIASVGLYGVVAFAVGQRTREFGIRVALGAGRLDVVRLVTADSLGITLVGVALGLALSLACTRLLRSFLYGLSPTDAATYATVALLWTAVSLAASCVPAFRAMKLDPAVALREE
jgi:putative ABC transport system permease protein